MHGDNVGDMRASDTKGSKGQQGERRTGQQGATGERARV
jgi:hypothetical protein